MDWDKASIIGTEHNKRWIKEAIEIPKQAQRTVRDEQGGICCRTTGGADRTKKLQEKLDEFYVWLNHKAATKVLYFKLQSTFVFGETFSLYRSLHQRDQRYFITSH